MKFIVYSETNQNTVIHSLGLPEYSYYFVLKSYLPLLQQMGEVIKVDQPHKQVDEIFDKARAAGEPCLFLTFSPPHRTITTLRCPTVPVFAWEFEDLPYESWGSDVNADCRRTLARLPGAITHSNYSVAAVKKLMGPDYAVLCIPAPLWESAQPRATTSSSTLRSLTMTFSGYLIDSRTVNWDEIAHHVHWDRKSNQSWLSATPAHNVTVQQLNSGTPIPITINKIHPLRQTINILKRHCANWYAEAIGDIVSSPKRHSPSPVERPQDPFGRDETLPQQLKVNACSEQHRLDITGIIYTSVLNAEDGRKNLRDLLSVFCAAFRDREDACLLLKITHALPERSLSRILAELYRCSPFKCRVVLVAGFLDDQNYQAMIDATSYVVNASHGEGQCLPLMEFMSAGIPAIAPTTSAMADYIDSDNAFIVHSSREITSWPHDPRQVSRTFRHRIDAESLHIAFINSYNTASNSEQYARMSLAARNSLKKFCSLHSAKESLQQFLNLPSIRQALQSDNYRGRPFEALFEEPYDIFHCGLSDAVMGGWFLRDTFEVVKGVKISQEDVVLDVGCGAGGATRFCADAGAYVIFSDIDEPKIQQLKQMIQKSPARGFEGIVCDSMPLPIPSGKATKILAMEMLEHVDDPLYVLKELVRVGAPGAQYVLSTPAPASELISLKTAPPAYFEKPNHIRIFSQEEFIAIVEKAGLTVEAQYMDGFYWSIWMALHWVAERGAGRNLSGAALDQITPPYHPVQEYWAKTWGTLLEMPGGGVLKDALDQVLPKRQTIIARKLRV